jgi:hypothetical protein
MLVNRPTDARAPTLAEERRMRFGIDFGRDVTKLFPGGVEITADYRHPQEALDDTTTQLHKRRSTIRRRNLLAKPQYCSRRRFCIMTYWYAQTF